MHMQVPHSSFQLCCSEIEALLLSCVTVSLQSNTPTQDKAAKLLKKKVSTE